VDKFHEVSAKTGAENDNPGIEPSEEPFVLHNLRRLFEKAMQN
jgi:hypothetical protein